MTHSGLWFDEADALEELNRQLDAGNISAAQFGLLKQFIVNGYVVLPEKIPEPVIDAINHDFDNAAANREKILLRKGGRYEHPGPLGIVGHRKRVIDFYVPCHAALEALLARPITDFLALLYHEAPLIFQSLLFQYGSQQGMHQDTAYVVTDNAAAIMASWIALEDIRAGSGELAYYCGSHRNIAGVFDNGKQIWDRHADDMESNQDYQKNLAAQCEAAGLMKETFLAQKGQILIWHAGLVHGGEPITHKDWTRKSLVAHYCPASGTPNYFRIPNETLYKRPFAGGLYASRHYDVRPASKNPYPIYTGGKDIAAEKGLRYDDE